MDYVEAASALGQAIVESGEFQAFKLSEANLMADEKATTLIQEYKDLQTQLVEASKEDLAREELEKIRDLLMAKQSQLNSYEITKAYFDGKRGFQNMMDTINDIIQHYVQGGDDCTGSCETCGGCH